MVRVLPKFRTVHHLIVLLTLAFIISFIYHEKIVPYRSAYSCAWPQVTQQGKRLDQPTPETKILFIADPQLIDNHTYVGRDPLLLKLSQHTVDNYIKKNFKSMVNRLQPDYIFFLGDYLDNGRSSTDEYFQHEYHRFEKLFLKSIDRHKYIKDTNVFINVPGNHDLGFGNGVKSPSRQRFQQYFGDPNKIISINNVEIVSLDTPSLSSSLEEIYQPTRQFIDEHFPATDSDTTAPPRILLTHVPLYRDISTQTCGALRESDHFSLGAGYQYKSALDSQISSQLLNQIRPHLIFSGDDHDYCDISHTEVSDAIRPIPREITVKSISMAMGIKFPAVQLLTFTSDVEGTGRPNLQYETHLCYLPTPYINIAHYVTLAVISGVLLLWWNMKQRSSRYNYSILPSSIHSTAILSNSYDFPSPASTTSSGGDNAKKISNFLKEQDEGSSRVVKIPNYTSTAQVKRNVKLTNTKVMKMIYRWKCKSATFMKKWNLFGFIKHSVFLALMVTSIYYFGFVLTV